MYFIRNNFLDVLNDDINDNDDIGIIIRNSDTKK